MNHLLSNFFGFQLVCTAITTSLMSLTYYSNLFDYKIGLWVMSCSLFNATVSLQCSRYTPIFHFIHIYLHLLKHWEAFYFYFISFYFMSRLFGLSLKRVRDNKIYLSKSSQMLTSWLHPSGEWRDSDSLAELWVEFSKLEMENESHGRIKCPFPAPRAITPDCV